MPFEREQFLAAGRVPHLGRLIVTAGDNPLAVRGKGHGQIRPLCPWRVSSSWPLAASHTLAVLSQLPVTIRWPSGEKATDRMPPLCPLSVSSSLPLAASHTLAV